MRRTDREITELKDLLYIVDSCKVCRVASQDETGMFIIPLNFGYEYTDEKLTIYIHSATKGRKVSAFEKSSNVAIEMDCEHSLVEGSIACNYGYKYRSIMGNGIISNIDTSDEKQRALTIIMKHQTGQNFEFNSDMVKSVLVFKIEVHNFTGKQRI